MKYLIISHDATRTGAPILLLNLAKLILKNEPNSVSFLLKRGGGLQSDFSNLAPTFYANQKIVHSFFSRFNKNRKTVVEDSIFLNQFDYIISNTITNGDILNDIRKNFKGKIITYIHELELASKTYTNSTNISTLIKCTDAFWVPSTLVNDFLKNDLNIPQSAISIMPYSIHNDNSKNLPNDFTSNKFTIGGCGTIDWRKGPDIFIIIAKRVLEKCPNKNIYFKWVGSTNGIELERLNYQLRKMSIENEVKFEPSIADVDAFYNSLDLFLLTSREDPYPLVILESASYGVPSICFDKVCGSKDFIINSDGGDVVPFLDIELMADTILKYLNDSEYRNKKGKNARQYLAETHSNEEYIYKNFIELLKKCDKSCQKESNR